MKCPWCEHADDDLDALTTHLLDEHPQEVMDNVNGGTDKLREAGFDIELRHLHEWSEN